MSLTVTATPIGTFDSAVWRWNCPHCHQLCQTILDKSIRYKSVRCGSCHGSVYLDGLGPDRVAAQVLPMFSSVPHLNPRESAEAKRAKDEFKARRMKRASKTSTKPRSTAGKS